MVSRKYRAGDRVQCNYGWFQSIRGTVCSYYEAEKLDSKIPSAGYRVWAWWDDRGLAFVDEQQVEIITAKETA